MTEDLDLLIEEECSKRYGFATSIADIELLPSPKYRKLALCQVKKFINVYKTFFDKHYTWYLKDILPLSIPVTPDTASVFDLEYLAVTEPDETELKIG